MKKNFYKIISGILCAVLLNISIIFSMSVKSFCDEVNPIEWLHDNFTETVSAIGGAVFNTTVDVWNAWKTLLGLNEQQFNDFIINGVSVGGDGNISISDDVADSIKNFVNDYEQNSQDFRYCYSYDIDYYLNRFASKSRFQAIKNFLSDNQNKVVIMYATIGAFDSDPNISNDVGSVAGGGANAFYLIVINDNISFVLNTINNGNRTAWDYIYNADWLRASLLNTEVKIYGFSSRGDINLTELDSLPPLFISSNDTLHNTLVRYYTDAGDYSWTMGGPHWVSYNTQSAPQYSTVNIMKQYSVGNLPYYNVPMNPSVNYNNGSYNVNNNQLDNSISYGDISSYVETNNVTEMNIVNNYINNYYGNGSGGSGGSGGTGGSGSDIDWSWLGKIGEVIGGLISALGNVVAGIIEGITNLITSLTESLPNVFGQCVNWLLPFIPQEIVSLLNALFLAILIVGVVRLIRGK